MLDTTPWPGLTLVSQITAGNRNEVWEGELDGSKVAVRQSRRSAASLQWELDLLVHLSERDFHVPVPVPASTGALQVAGIVVQRWLEGAEPVSRSDWALVASELQRLHRVGAHYPQRPESCSILELADQRVSVDADLDAMPTGPQHQVVAEFARFADAPVSLIHGDPWAPNIRVVDGRVGLLDWDESRVDVSWHDLSNLQVQVLDDVTHERAQRLSNAWEAANGWIAEPDYARARLTKLTVYDQRVS